jgi:hypothetical protein
MAKLRYHKNKAYFSTLTCRYYRSFDAVFRESLRAGGGAYNDFNICLVHADGTDELVF